MAFWMYSSGSTGRPEGHRASAARHGLHAPVVRPPPAAADARRHLLLGAEDLLRLRLRQLDHLSLLRSAPRACCCRASPSRPPSSTASRATARRSSSACRPSTPRSPSAPEAAGADLSSLRLAVSAAEVLSADVFNGWKAHVGPRDHGGARLQRGAAHLSVEHGRDAKKLGAAGKRVPGYEIRLERQPRARRWRTARKASCGCAATPTRPSTGTVPTRPPRPCARAAGSTPATASCATPTASTSSAAAPTTWSRSAANGSTRSRSSCAWPTIHRCASARCWPSKAPTASPCSRHSSSSTPARAQPRQTTKALQDYVKARLLPYKYPRIVAYLDELPKTGSGKIDRQALLKLETLASPLRGEVGTPRT